MSKMPGDLDFCLRRIKTIEREMKFSIGTDVHELTERSDVIEQIPYLKELLDNHDEVFLHVNHNIQAVYCKREGRTFHISLGTDRPREVTRRILGVFGLYYDNDKTLPMIANDSNYIGQQKSGKITYFFQKSEEREINR